VLDLMNDVRGIWYGSLNLAPPTYAEIPPMRNSPVFPLQLVGTLSSLARRLALKCLEISPPHRFVAHSVSGLDTPRNQSHHLRCCRHFSDHDTRQPARQGEGEELERTSCGGMGLPTVYIHTTHG
jgi:hypothetical protein